MGLGFLALRFGLGPSSYDECLAWWFGPSTYVASLSYPSDTKQPYSQKHVQVLEPVSADPTRALRVQMLWPHQISLLCLAPSFCFRAWRLQQSVEIMSLSSRIGASGYNSRGFQRFNPEKPKTRKPGKAFIGLGPKARNYTVVVRNR